jgi:hypothetical protein
MRAALVLAVGWVASSALFAAAIVHGVWVEWRRDRALQREIDQLLRQDRARRTAP